MALKVVFRPAGERDLQSLYIYVRDRSGPEIALGYVRRVRAFCEGFETFPERGRRRDDLRAGLRVASFERRVAFAYRVAAGAVEIGRVFYGGRDVDALLAEERHDE